MSLEQVSIASAEVPINKGVVMTQRTAVQPDTGEMPALGKKLLLLLAAGAGLSVANSYYNQPMLGRLAEEFGVGPAAVAAIPFATLIGNTTGVIFIAPLGDKIERRRLIVVTTFSLASTLVAASMASGFLPLILSSFFIGLFATVAQQIVPLSVHIAPATSKGQTLGFVTGGILLGILLSRTVSGAVTEWWDWRLMFQLAAALMFILTVLFAFKLPQVRPTTTISYSALLRSLAALLITHRTLRIAILIQALVFGAFLAFWSNLALLFSLPHFDLGPSAVGMMAIIGAAGVFVAPVAGRFADRHGSENVISAGAALVVLAFVVFAIFPGSLWALAIGVLIMDVAVQSSQVANQARVFALDPTARSRLNTVFMATMLFGGAIGAGLGGLAFSHFGWSGTCAVGSVAAGLAFILSRFTIDHDNQ
ncbi:MFS transporter [Pannonibacter sp. P2PFMT1]|uniref:MFS transporter n=1 Tax=Pannonibacter sp. P2PFMT1 TaxID=2003582 RepID=UPI001FCBFD01|nr:MFS transporter [Pannonibacter sp. P2PFMT1]